LIAKEEIPDPQERWDLEVDGVHNFIANGIVVHNSNVRIALVDGVEMAGSHNIRRLRPEKPMTAWRAIKRALRIKEPISYGDEIKNDLYWHAWSIPEVREMLVSLSQNYKSAVLYGEIYGKVQELTYGLPNDIAFRAFDLMLDGKYVDAELFYNTCARFGVPVVPELYRGPYSLEKIRELAQGNSTLPGANHMREGAVVRPMEEREHRRIGRVILKYIGDEYLCSKGYNENKDV